MKNKFSLKLADGLDEGLDNFITLASDGAMATDKLKAVDGVAYSGGTVGQSWSGYPIVIALSGMELAPQIPLLYSHYNSPSARLGVVTGKIESNRLTINGGIDEDLETSKGLIKAGKKIKWQLSIGAAIVKMKLTERGESVVVNGQTFEGPVLVVEKSLLREVSIVAVGADKDTYLNIAASLNLSVDAPKNQKGNPQMNKNLMKYIIAKYKLAVTDEESIKAKLAALGRTAEQEEIEMKATETETARIRTIADAENQRIDAIRAACGDTAEIRNEAITAGWTVEQTQRVMASFEKATKSHGNAGGNIIVKSVLEVTASAIEAAVAMGQGITGKALEAYYSEKDLETASKPLRGITLKGLIEQCAHLENHDTGLTFSDTTIRAGFSTVSLPGILSNVANKKALQAFTSQPIVATKLCTKGDLNDFKQHERFRIVDVGDLQELSPAGEIKHGSLGEDKATNKLATYAKMFTLTRQMIYNDDLGELLKVPVAMGQRGARKIDQVFFKRLLSNPVQSDSKALFHTGHKNIKTGNPSALSFDAIKAGVASFAAQVDGDGQPISVEPAFLLVPPELYGLALELTLAQTLTGGTATIPTLNIVNRFGLETVRSPYLSNAMYPNYSDTGWYLFGNPSQIDTFEIGYFQGRETPTVEQGDVDFNTLGMSFRVYFDFGIREQGTQGMLFSAGK